MGGIKNKLSKLSNKITQGSPWVRGAVSRRLTEGSLSAGLSLTILTKYLGIACLSLAILSTLVLNIISSYSNSSTRSNAEPVAQANSTLVSGPAEISLSISPITTPTSSPDTSNPANVSMQIPDDGGMATGGHTVTVNTGSDISQYALSLSTSGSDNNLVNDQSDVAIESADGSLAENDQLQQLSDKQWGFAISSEDVPILPSGERNNFNPADSYEGDVVGDIDQYALYARVPTSNELNSNPLSGLIRIDTQTSDTRVYYGTKVDHPESTPAGNYTAQVVYSVTAKLQEPVLTNIEPSTYELGSNDSNTITITGKYLSTASKVYLTNTDTSANNASTQYDCTNLQLLSNDANGNTTLTCNIPTDTTSPAIDDPGTYNLTIETEGGTTTNEDAITYTPALPDGMLQSTADYGSDGHVAVDYDENMVPITYTGNETTPKWVIADTSNTNSDTNLNWYDYPNKKWANAVTLTEEGLSLYKGKPAGTEIDEQYVLGYWVYIPRYAYKVMRKEVADKVVTDEVAKNNGKGGFEIVFEANDDIVKEPAICNSSNANQYYQDCIKNQYGEAGIDYPGNNEDLKDKTAWATHPAFTWQYTQEVNGFDMTYGLNGIWVGKFETTGNTERPTVLPNQKHIASGLNIGDYYDIAKSIGAEDKNNKYGNSTQTGYNNGTGYHNLVISNSHMLKNSEWGAVAYLSASRYGAGVSGVQVNSNAMDTWFSSDSGWRTGVTGCGPLADGDDEVYTQSGVIGTNNACGDVSRNYSGDLGRLASTTRNPYGIYDMSGGAWEYVAGSYTENIGLSSGQAMSQRIQPPYVDLYTRNNGFTGNRTSNNDLCMWSTCGGHALHETKNHSPVTSELLQSWNNDNSGFTYSTNSWFERSGHAANGPNAGIFLTAFGNGNSNSRSGFRVTILTLIE